MLVECRTEWVQSGIAVLRSVSSPQLVLTCRVWFQMYEATEGNDYVERDDEDSTPISIEPASKRRQK